LRKLPLKQLNVSGELHEWVAVSLALGHAWFDAAGTVGELAGGL
jgi:hypothetical protein